ncbi:hypothetical protein [Brevibacterium moorei]|uniref:hypothetical protein n=1 Tax=Brevibacterium moorei TaxID=2968457 RepID=UPI00211D0C20|nr:hypothetical protein [Brevibacterium sp. 68QC2CO]MCQ9384392.1 hypothetical protein [Brevibacterium sp. 68QC2CO]
MKETLNANGRLHWRAAVTRKQLIAQLTAVSARGLKPVGRATVVCGVVKATRQAYDAQNMQPSLKAVVDQLVRMGVLDEDSNRFVTGPLIVPAGVDRGLAARGPVPQRLRFEVSLLPYLDAEEIVSRLALP